MKWVTRKKRERRPRGVPLANQEIRRSGRSVPLCARRRMMSRAEREGAIPYDVKDIEFGHVDARCSFESILSRLSSRILL